MHFLHLFLDFRWGFNDTHICLIPALINHIYLLPEYIQFFQLLFYQLIISLLSEGHHSIGETSLLPWFAAGKRKENL